VIATERIPGQQTGQTRQPRLPVIALAQATRRSHLVALDWFERLLLLGFFGWLVARMLAHYLATRQAANLVLLPSEGLVVVLVLIRRPASQLSRSAADWLMALIVTCSFMLVAPVSDASLIPAALGVFVVLMGTVIQIHAKMALGRSFGCVPAHRGLKLGGPYQMVRHPMYAGYLLSHMAFLAMNPTWWNAAIYAFCYGLQIPRLLAEERLLARDPAYRSYQATVRYRLVPGVF
jgi:protein-S-isoprenylcysteine O-methyltransferase Ste14